MWVDAQGAVEVSVSGDSLDNVGQDLGLEKQTYHGATKVMQSDLWVSSTSTDSSKRRFGWTREKLLPHLSRTAPPFPGCPVFRKPRQRFLI